jgi:hypothetical protein
MKMTTNIPPGVAIPETVETRLGTLPTQYYHFCSDGLCP